MAGYSGTPLPKKLGIKEASTVALSRAPDDFESTLGPLPDGASLRRSVRGELDVIVAFFTRRAELERRIEQLIGAMQPATRLWIAWPKRASGVATNVTEDVIRELGLAAGVVDNKVCAIDQTWSGLQLVIRLRDR